MVKNTIIKYLEIPKDYVDFIEFIEKYSDLILSDEELMPRILNELNQRLNDAKNPCDLHHDSSMMLATIRFYQDAFLKEYNHNLSIQKIIKMANDDLLESYYDICKEQFRKAKFIDTLTFSYLPKETTQRIRKIRDNLSEESLNIPRVLSDVEEKCKETEAILDIKKLELNDKIEYFELILDKNSYSKTVYNIFNLSLALRNKAVSLIEENNKIYATCFYDSKEQFEHNVIELTYEIYNKLVKIFK